MRLLLRINKSFSDRPSRRGDDRACLLLPRLCGDLDLDRLLSDDLDLLPDELVCFRDDDDVAV